MARSIFASFLFFVALFVGLTSSNAQVVVNCSTTVQLNVSGVIVCTPFGNLISGFPNVPVVGVNVTLSCNGGQSTIAQVVTNSMGFFQLTVNASNLNLSNISSCRVTVPLPVNASCLALPISGSLQAPITITNIVPTAVGIVVNFLTALFVLV